MGCPQSKPKTSETGNDVTERGRGDTVYPDSHANESVTNEQILKQLTKGNPDVYIPEEANTHGQKQGSMRGSLGNAKKSSANSEGKNGLSHSNSNASDVNSMNGHEKKSSVKRLSKKQRDQHIPISSVFIPDNNPEVDEKKYKGTEKSSVYANTVDVSDVDVGQGIDEVSIENQTINENDLVRNKSYSEARQTGNERGRGEEQERAKFPEGVNQTNLHTSVKLSTDEGYTFEEKSTKTNAPSTVRYQNKDQTEYGLPESVPRPAPPRSKKTDIVKPNTFVLADKLVDTAPTEAFSSMTTLAGYLSGTVKHSEVEGKPKDEGENRESELPPPRPSNRKKKDIIPDVGMFKKIDDNAKNTPDTVVLSVDKLAAHLTSIATNDLEKIRAIYFWICNNISYMYAKDRSEIEGLRFDAVSTLRQKQGSFVNLFTALCKEAKVPAVTILGCSKGLRHQPDKQFSVAERNHSWNAVYIDGEWRFIDCTWGSGYLDIDGKFHRLFDEFWFLTDPDTFVYDHFPTHSIWQLLEKPIDIEEFNKKPSLTEKSRELGFQLISHQQPLVTFQDEVTIRFGTETFPLSNILAELKDSENKELNHHRCMRRIDEKTFEVRVVPPEVGQYSLQLFGKAKDYRHAKFRKLMEYTLRCEKVSEKQVKFPEHAKAWGMEPNYAELGFADSVLSLSVLNSDSNELSFTVEQTKVVNMTVDLKTVEETNTNLKECVLVTAKDKMKVVYVRFPQTGYYRLDIFAEGDLEKFEYAGSLLLYCSVTEKPKPFPKFNSEAISKHVVELIEPMYQEIPAESEVMFKLRSRVMKKAMLGIPVEEEYGSRLKGLGELTKSGDVFSIKVKTPAAGESVLLSGCSAPPNVFWSRLYEYVTV